MFVIAAILCAGGLIAPSPTARVEGWQEICKTPAGHCPQGMASDGKTLYLSAYKGREEKSTVFALERSRDDGKFKPVFDLPAEARHTSGLCFVPGRSDRLFAIDYRSNMIYLLDFTKSCKRGRAVVLASVASGLDRASACCVARLPNGKWVLVVSEFKVIGGSRNALFDFHLGSRNPAAKGALRPAISSSTLFQPFANHFWSQGLKFRGGYVFETGNRPPWKGGSYVIKYRLEDALRNQRLTPLKEWDGPAPKIEDLEFFDGSLWVTQEDTNRLYKLRWED
jgi:hypothetical protein